MGHRMDLSSTPRKNPAPANGGVVGFQIQDRHRAVGRVPNPGPAQAGFLVCGVGPALPTSPTLPCKSCNNQPCGCQKPLGATGKRGEKEATRGPRSPADETTALFRLRGRFGLRCEEERCVCRRQCRFRCPDGVCKVEVAPRSVIDDEVDEQAHQDDSTLSCVSNAAHAPCSIHRAPCRRRRDVSSRCSTKRCHFLNTQERILNPLSS